MAEISIPFHFRIFDVLPFQLKVTNTEEFLDVIPLDIVEISVRKNAYKNDWFWFQKNSNDLPKTPEECKWTTSGFILKLTDYFV
jgi:hypothetical protein